MALLKKHEYGSGGQLTTGNAECSVILIITQINATQSTTAELQLKSCLTLYIEGAAHWRGKQINSTPETSHCGPVLQQLSEKASP